MQIKDQLHRKLSFLSTPQRIISLVPSQTELLIDLGLKTSVVGITKFCVHPKNLRKEIAVVGGTKQVNFEKIKSLHPDFILCNKEENTLEMVIALEKIAPVWVSDITTIEDSMSMITQLGQIFRVAESAKAITSLISSEIKHFKKAIEQKPKRSVVYLIWKNPYMAAGRNTFIDHLLALNNFDNCITQDRYPQVALSDLQKPQLILLSSEPYPFNEKHISDMTEKTNADIQLVDGEYFSWYGSRLTAAFRYFRSLHD